MLSMAEGLNHITAASFVTANVPLTTFSRLHFLELKKSGIRRERGTTYMSLHVFLTNHVDGY